MKKSQTPQPQEQVKDLAYWENEIEYFERAIDGLQTTYSVMMSLLQHAKEQFEQHIPSSDDIK